MTLLFADDQPVELAGLEVLVAPGDQTLRVVTDPREVMARALHAPPKLIIAGFFLSKRGQLAFELVRACREGLPDTPLLMRAPYDDPHLRIGLRFLGVGGLIATGAPLEQLRQAITAVYSRIPWFTPIPDDTPLLTARDLEMVQALAAGAGHKELATRLRTSRTAIDKRLAKLRERFGAPSTTSLVAWSLERGLAYLPPETLEDGRTIGPPRHRKPRNPETRKPGNPETRKPDDPTAEIKTQARSGSLPSSGPRRGTTVDIPSPSGHPPSPF